MIPGSFNKRAMSFSPYFATFAMLKPEYACWKFFFLLRIVVQERPAWLISKINLPKSSSSESMAKPYWVS